MQKNLKVNFNDNGEFILEKKLLELADWQTGEYISIQYDEEKDRLLLKNVTDVFVLRKKGSIAVSNELIEEVSLPINSEFTAVYDKSSDNVIVHLTPQALNDNEHEVIESANQAICNSNLILFRKDRYCNS